jgi:hypothetical protein
MWEKKDDNKLHIVIPISGIFKVNIPPKYNKKFDLNNGFINCR